MPRFFLSGGSSIAGGTAFILGEDAAHAKVLRLRVGDTMIVCDGGKDHHCTVTKITPNEVEAEIFEVVPCQGEPSVHTVILAGLPKGSDKTDYILQKCTEAGASEIYFFASSRCVARIQGDADKKIARWQRIAEEAAKQSGRGDPRRRIPARSRGGLQQGECHRAAPLYVRNRRARNAARGRGERRKYRLRCHSHRSGGRL